MKTRRPRDPCWWYFLHSGDHQLLPLPSLFFLTCCPTVFVQISTNIPQFEAYGPCLTLLAWTATVNDHHSKKKMKDVHKVDMLNNSLGGFPIFYFCKSTLATINIWIITEFEVRKKTKTPLCLQTQSCNLTPMRAICLQTSSCSEGWGRGRKPNKAEMNGQRIQWCTRHRADPMKPGK